MLFPAWFAWVPLVNHITYLDKSSFEKQKQTTAMTFGRRLAFKKISKFEKKEKWIYDHEWWCLNTG